MSKKLDFKLNLPGLNELMKSPAMQAELEQKGAQIANSASAMSDGGEFKVRTVTGRWIATTYVSAEDGKAIHACFENNVLLKARDGGSK